MNLHVVLLCLSMFDDTVLVVVFNQTTQRRARAIHVLASRAISILILRMLTPWWREEETKTFFHNYCCMMKKIKLQLLCSVVLFAETFFFVPLT